MTNDIKERILKWFDKAMTPKCEKCGGPLPAYPYYDENYEIRHCENCGNINRKRRVKQWRKI